ncbi:unnamed protein product [Acanthoscelides obtectus]|uniref:Mos1 transposase HTH domain-containing protein n=1 Tax=Acanthoscelides obtectus TaxID=200917 RepID=A0A9P0M8N9_ACAOB|nr:unnamed protein product [Acanthoscelides obtectus]CAK1662279.1 hypothetical protein AOBTE_LOCUS23068 [Acanthoscelides obtectus]
MELNREHFRAIIYYNFQRQLSQQKCLAELLSVFGNEAPNQSTISRWYGEFKRGRVSLRDDSRVGAPKTAVTQENVDAVRKLIIEDRHASLKISKTSIQKILHEELGVRKLLKAARVNWCQKMLDRFNSGNSKNVYSIITVWVFQGEEKPTKVIRSRSVSKKRVETIVLKAKNYNASSHTAQRIRQYLTEENSPEEAVDAFKNAVLDLPANEWNKCFENWFERMQM